MEAPHTTTTAAAIWYRILKPADTLLSVEAAQFFLDLDVSQEDRDRAHVLAAKARDGTLSSTEKEEIQAYEQVGNILSMLKSKARQRLKRRS